ncbi:MAG: type 1 glutamine amidotransferase [Cyanophyceae cyanobacterium]
MQEDSRVLVIRHIEGSGLGLLEKFLKHKGVPIRYFNIASGDALTDAVTDYSHLILLGGPISAYEEDKHPFLLHEFALVETALAQQIPTVGICLGSQVLARVLGAKVYRGEQGREAGWCEVQFNAAARRDWLFQDFPERLQVFESHQDTFDIPPGCVHLASSDQYPVRFVA